MTAHPGATKLNAEAISDLADRARQALEGVTEGRWETRTDYGEPTRVVFSGEIEFSLFQCCDCPVEAGALNPRDAEFIAEARTLVPELVAEIERLQQVIENIREHARRWGTDYHLPQECSVIAARILQDTAAAVPSNRKANP